MSENIPTAKCEFCHNYFDVDNMEEIKNVGIVCDKCCTDHFCHCFRCRKSFKFEDMYCNDTCRLCFESKIRFRKPARNDYNHF